LNLGPKYVSAQSRWSKQKDFSFFSILPIIGEIDRNSQNPKPLYIVNIFLDNTTYCDTLFKIFNSF